MQLHAWRMCREGTADRQRSEKREMSKFQHTSQKGKWLLKSDAGAVFRRRRFEGEWDESRRVTQG